MNWITNMVRPKVSNWWNKRDTAENLWRKCPNCGEMIFHRDLAANDNVCTNCGFHMKIAPEDRLKTIFDGGEWEELPLPDVQDDPLSFRDEKRYTDRLKDARSKTGRRDAMILTVGMIEGHQSVVLIQNFAFMGGSLGMGAGEAFLTAAEKALELNAPLIIFTASGGARMQEGILSLMQMPRTTVGVQMLRDAGLPYIVVLTHPTTGGVTASYAMLGDVHLAEPGALIGFAGPRVIEQTIRERLPDGFQRSEYLLDHGMVDMVVHRHDVKKTLAQLVDLLMITQKAPSEAQATPVADPDVTPEESAGGTAQEAE